MFQSHGPVSMTEFSNAKLGSAYWDGGEDSSYTKTVIETPLNTDRVRRLISHHFFFLIEPTRRTPHLCGIVLAMGLVMGHTLHPLLACFLVIPNWYHYITPYFYFVLRQCAHRIDILLLPFPFFATVRPSVKFWECEPMPERSTTNLESCHTLR